MLYSKIYRAPARKRRLAAASLGLTAICIALSASATELILSDQPIYVGEQFIGTVTLPDEGGPLKLDDIDSDTLSIKLIDTNSVGSNTVIRISGIALREGKQRIPPIVLRGRISTHTTAAKDIQVEKPQTSELIQLTTTWSTNKVYVGQPFTLDFIWKLKAPTDQFAGVDIRVPLLEHVDFSVYHAAGNPAPGSRNSIGLPVSGTRVIAATQGDTIRFTKILVPKKSGTFAFKPAQIVCSVREEEKNQRNRGFQYPSYFDNQFFHQPDSAGFKRIFQSAEPFALTVHELPTENRPLEFNGIFGAFDLSVSATPTEIQVGDPATVQIDVSNHPFLETITLPQLSELTGFKGLFDIPAARAPGLIRNGVRTYRQTVRPMREGIKAIPPIRFHIFDPETATYKIIASTPIPITVHPSSVAGAGDAILSDGTRLRSTVKHLDNGLQQNYSRQQIYKKHRLATKPMTAWLTALLLPPALFLVFNRVTRIQQLRLHDPDRARQLLAYKTYQSNAGNPRRRLQQYLSDRFKLSKRFPVYRDVATHLNELSVSHQTRDDLNTLFNETSADLFSKQSKSDETTIQQTADRLVKIIEEQATS